MKYLVELLNNARNRIRWYSLGQMFLLLSMCVALVLIKLIFIHIKAKTGGILETPKVTSENSKDDGASSSPKSRTRLDCSIIVRKKGPG